MAEYGASEVGAITRIANTIIISLTTIMIFKYQKKQFKFRRIMIKSKIVWTYSFHFSSTMNLKRAIH